MKKINSFIVIFLFSFYFTVPCFGDKGQAITPKFVLNTEGAVNVIDYSSEKIPKTFELFQNFPNPFNSSTKIKFSIPKTVDVKLMIYNILGQKVNTLIEQRLIAGTYEIKWNGENEIGEKVASGIYLYSLQLKDFRKTAKLILLK